MAKNTFLDWSTTASSNTDVGGIGILGTNAVNNFDDALRTTMAQLRSGLDGNAVYAAKSGNYTAVANDNNGYMRFTAAATLSLTAVATLGANWHLFVQADGGDVLVDPNASETINGATTINIRNGESALIVSSGSAFFARINPAQLAYASKSGNYTAVAADNGAVHRYTAAATASLTAAATLGSSWNYTVVADGAAVTIDPNASETINGLTTIIVPNGSSAKIICDGSNFFTVFKPNGWQTIEKRVFSAVSAIDFTNLGAYSSLRLTGRVIISASAVLGWRSSTNNGSSYDAGASDYSNQGTSISDTVFSGARTASSFGTISAGLQFAVNAIFNDFNFSGNGCYSTSVSTTSLTTGIANRIDGAIRSDSTARNALRLLPTSAVTLTGYLTLEGCI